MAKMIVATKKEIEILMQIRLEMLKSVNQLADNYVFDQIFIDETRKYFLNGDQTTILAVEGEAVGCASICYIHMMPTFSHPTGKRAHIMNVYTRPEFRRQKIASQMLQILMKEAVLKGVTEISLDATDSGKPLYQKYGFTESGEYMVLDLNK